MGAGAKGEPPSRPTGGISADERAATNSHASKAQTGRRSRERRIYRRRAVAELAANRRKSPPRDISKARRKDLGGAGSRGQGEGAPLRTQPPTREGKYGRLLKISGHVCAPGACPCGWGSGGRSISAQRTGASSPRHRTKKPAAVGGRHRSPPKSGGGRMGIVRDGSGERRKECPPRPARPIARARVGV